MRGRSQRVPAVVEGYGAVEGPTHSRQCLPHGGGTSQLWWRGGVPMRIGRTGSLPITDKGAGQRRSLCVTRYIEADRRFMSGYAFAAERQLLSL